MKNGSNDEFCLENVLGQILYGIECLFMFRNVWMNLGIKFGHWKSKLEFWGENGSFSRD
jgi:hypothetical protein